MLKGFDITGAVQAASANTRGLAALLVIVLFFTTRWAFQGAERKRKLITLTVFGIAVAAIIAVSFSREGKAGPSAPAKADIHTDHTTQSGQTNVNGVGGNVVINTTPREGSTPP